MTEEQEIEVLDREINALFDDPYPFRILLDRQERARAAAARKSAHNREYNATHKQERESYRRQYRIDHPEKVRALRQAASLRRKLGIKNPPGRPRGTGYSAKKGGENKHDE